MQRKAFDFYQTPKELVIAGIKLIPPMDCPKVVDPGAGDGAWGTEYKKLYPGATLIGVDLRDVEQPLHYDHWLGKTDFLSSDSELLKGADLILGNPPYGLALSFVHRSLALTKEGGYVFQLLRLGFLASIKRYQFWKENPPYKIWVITPRPSFTNGGNDNSEYMLALWAKGYKEQTTVDWLKWR